ncbi:MAG: hypothetical protein R3B45_12275 [Bdellovibrionota bacterium]
MPEENVNPPNPVKDIKDEQSLYRVISFNTNVTENRPKIQLTTILDNSNSMQPIQTKVATAFSQVANKLKGFGGSVDLYTTTNTWNSDKNSFAIKEYYQYNLDGQTVDVAYSEKSSIPQNVSYSLIKDYRLTTPFLDSNSPLTFESSMADIEFSNFVSDYAYAVGQIGTQGSSVEQGLCTLLRKIKSQGPSSDFQVYLLASNENDSTSVQDCIDQEKIMYERSVKTLESNQPCKEGDVDCMYDYRVSYAPYSKEKNQFTYRDVARKLIYTAAKPLVDYKGKIEWTQSRNKISYKYNNMQRKISYRKILVKDNIPYDDSTLSYYNYSDIPGSCAIEGTVSCTSDQIAMLDAPYGIVADSCAYTCQTKASQLKVKYVDDWHVGTCSTLTASSCNEVDVDFVRGSLQAMDIPFCEKSCVQGSNNYTAFIPDPPVHCGNASNSCSSMQEAYLRDKVGMLSSTSPILGCSVLCNEAYRKEALDLPSIPQCENVPVNKDGMEERACTADELAQAEVALGEAIGTCRYTCTQSIQSSEYFTSELSQCVESIDSCNSEQLSDVALKINKSEDYIASCQHYCVANQMIDDCMLKSSDASLCNSGFNKLKQTCTNANQLDLVQNSCQIISSAKKVATNSYQTVEKPVKTASLAQQEDVSSYAAGKLIDSYGSNFYVTAFIYPQNDQTCDPSKNPNYLGDKSIFIGSKYEKLISLVGEKRGKIFPLCLQDYSESLRFVLDLVTQEVKKSYLLDYDQEKEAIESIILKDENGQEIKASADSYSLFGTVIKFSDSFDISKYKVIEVKLKTKVPSPN